MNRTDQWNHARDRVTIELDTDQEGLTITVGEWIESQPEASDLDCPMIVLEFSPEEAKHLARLLSRHTGNVSCPPANWGAKRNGTFKTIFHHGKPYPYNIEDRTIEDTNGRWVSVEKFEQDHSSRG